MNKYISIIVLLSLFVIGCTEQTSITSPENKVPTQEPNWISLPNGKSGMSVMSRHNFRASAMIDGGRGGKISIKDTYTDEIFGKVTVKAELEFSKGAFPDSKEITMILDSEYGSATFSPHAFFLKDAIYNAELTGLDLTGVNPKNISFVYQAEDGSYEYIDYSKIEVDLKNGKLKVRDAKLPHFSRYGFVN